MSLAERIYYQILGHSQKHPRGWYRWHGKLYTASAIWCIALRRAEELEAASKKQSSSYRLGYDPEPHAFRQRAKKAESRFTRAISKTGGSFV